MSLGEFTLIERYFGRPAEASLQSRGDVLLGIGDDAAVLDVPSGRQLVAALDTLVEGRHFPVGSAPRSIGHRALAVNLSDLAAMGAEPAWFLLALTLPAADESFLGPFARGMLELAAVHGVALVGGDTTAGPLSISVQALGFIEPGRALRRAGGAPGDLLYVSGTPGDSTAGLQLAMQVDAGAGLNSTQRQYLLDRFHFPEPRVALGRALRGIASACIDVSDGLAADAGKLAAASGCGVTLQVERLPLSASLRALAGADAARHALGGGEDYELCFTVPPAQVPALEAAADNVKCPVTCIGKLDANGGVTVSEYGNRWDFDARGFDHFSTG
jgi:thiamine-monophosphate kinase